VLTDFGIATIEGDGITTTRSDQVVGSPQYMAPERALSGAKLPASDLWSLGATLYAAVEGRPPYKRPSAVGTLTAIAADEPDPTELAGPMKPALDALLRKDPATRVGIDETRRLLRTAAAHTGRAALPPPAPAETAPASPAAPPASPASPAASPVSAASPAASPASPAASPTSPAEPGPPPGALVSPDRESRPRRWLTIAAGAVVVLLVAGLATWFATRSGGAAQDASSAPAAPSAAATPAPAKPTTTAKPTTIAESTAGTRPATSAGTNGTAARPPLPAGWRDYRDKTGFSVYVPTGWSRSQDGSIVYFRDSRTGRVLGIDQTDQPQWNPVADWRGKASYRVAHGDFPGYHEVHIVKVDYFRTAADWEYSFSGKHVNNRGFVVSAHQAYGIYWQTSDSTWAAARPDLQLIFDSFRPAAG
jgi:hypothetical protein